MNKLDEESNICMKMYNDAYEAYMEAVKASANAREAFIEATKKEHAAAIASCAAYDADIEAQKRERDAYTFWSTFRI
jgi:hypothetical protein